MPPAPLTLEDSAPASVGAQVAPPGADGGACPSTAWSTPGGWASEGLRPATGTAVELRAPPSPGWRHRRWRRQRTTGRRWCHRRAHRPAGPHADVLCPISHCSGVFGAPFHRGHNPGTGTMESSFLPPRGVAGRGTTDSHLCLLMNQASWSSIYSSFLSRQGNV